MDRAAADRLLAKLHAFASTLDRDERALLGALLAPALARAHQRGETAARDEEVVGFGATEWDPDALPEALLNALRESTSFGDGGDGANERDTGEPPESPTWP